MLFFDVLNIKNTDSLMYQLRERGTDIIENITLTDHNESKEKLKNQIFLSLIIKYISDKIRYKDLIANNETVTDSFFYKVLEKLSYLNPSKIIFSLTDANSIYFRFYKFSKEINLEVFYTKDYIDDDIEAVISVYDRDFLIVKDYGTIDSIFKKLNEVLVFPLPTRQIDVSLEELRTDYLY